MPMTIKGVFFDAAGTLFTAYPSVGAIYSRIARKYGMELPIDLTEQYFAEQYNLRNGIGSLVGRSDERTEFLWWKELVYSVVKKITAPRDFDTYFDELFKYFTYAEAWKLYPDTLGVLTQLREMGLVLGIISNWDSRLLKVCRNLGIDSYFGFILISAIEGFAKPSPKIFLRALEIAKLNPEEALHVGDSVENDYLGATAVGMPALIVDRKQELREDMNCQGVRVVGSLAEINKYLRG